jgi:alpha-L-rhamnosidase
LPDAKLENVKVNNKLLKDTELKSSQSNKNISVELTSGSYEFNYLPEVAYIKYYGIDVKLGELVANEEVKKIVGEKLPMMMAEDMIERSGNQSLRELSFAPFSPVTNEILEGLDKILNKIKIDTTE